MTISIGAVVGGPECSFFRSHLSRLMTYCIKNSSNGSESGIVNIVYHLPGSIIKPDYVGVRTGRISKKEKMLVVQVGVEEEWIASTDAHIVLRFIYESADEALGLATTEFGRHGIKYDLATDRRFLDQWKLGEGFYSYLDDCSKDA